MAKADLIKEAKKLGLEVDDSMTAKQIQALIDSAPEGEDSGEDEEDQPKEAPSKKSKKGDTYMVAKEFRDKDNFSKVWKYGHDVSHFDQERLGHLVNTGMVTKK